MIHHALPSVLVLNQRVSRRLGCDPKHKCAFLSYAIEYVIIFERDGDQCRCKKPSNAARRRPKAPSHRRLSSCRNNRAVGYQGLSSRSSSQRQSGTNGSNIQTGLASAPARWATLVSTATTRSMFAASAAVSEKSFSSSPK